MGQPPRNSGHRRSSSFDIRNFSFMKSSHTKSQRHSNEKRIDPGRHMRPSYVQRELPSVRREHEGKRVQSLPVWLKDSGDKSRHRSASEPEEPARGQLWRKVTKWPTQKLSSNECKMGSTPERHMKKKNEKIESRYVDKSCSPILQIVARYHTPAVVSSGKKLEEIGERNSSNDRGMLPKIEESVTASFSSPQARTNGERDEVRQPASKEDYAVQQNDPSKCGHCGRTVEPCVGGQIEEISEQTVQNVRRVYPYLVEVVDSVRSSTPIPKPVVDMIRTQIVSALQSRSSDAENGSRLELVDPRTRTHPTYLTYSMDSMNTRENMTRTRRAFPFGVLRKKVSPRNPMKTPLNSSPHSAVKPPPYNWVSPLPHTPGIGSRRKTSVASARSPTSTSATLPPASIAESSSKPIKVESSPAPTVLARARQVPEVVAPKAASRLRKVPDKCIEWYEKITDDQVKDTEREKRGGKCEEWYAKIAGTGGGWRAREENVVIDSNAHARLRRALKRASADPDTTEIWKRQEDERKRKYSSRNSSSPEISVPVTSSPNCKKSVAEKTARKYSRGKQFTEVEEEKGEDRSPRSFHENGHGAANPLTEAANTRYSPKASSATTVPAVSSSQQYAAASPMRPRQAATPQATQSPATYSPAAIEAQEGGRGTVNEVEAESTVGLQPPSDLTNERSSPPYSRGDTGRRMSSLIERRPAAKRPDALTYSIPSAGPATQVRSAIACATRPRLRKMAPTKMIPESYCRVSMKRDARNQIRMYKAKNGMVHSLNPFLWFRRTNEKKDGRLAMLARTVRPLVSTVAGNPSQTHSKLQRLGRNSISPSPARSWSVLSTGASGELKTTTLQKLEGGVGDLICAVKPKITDRKVVTKRTTTRAQIFRSQFIQKKIRLVNNYNDSWWKNFNSQSLPLASFAAGGRRVVPKL